MASLQYVEKEAFADPPVLAIFSSGTPSTVADKTDFTLQYFSNDDEKKGYLFGQSSETYFVGKNFGGNVISKSRNNYAVALFKPGKPAKIVSANGLFNMKETNIHDAGGIDEETITASDFTLMRSELTERFGSLKRRRELRSVEANKFNINANESTLLAVSKAMSVAEAEAEKLGLTGNEDVLEQNRRVMLPPFDSQTDEVENIYKVDEMIPRSVQSTLNHDELINPTESEEDSQNIYPKFVLYRRPRLGVLAQNEAKRQSRLLLFIAFLLRLYRLPKKYVSQLDESLMCSPEVAEFLRVTFMDPQSQSITREMKTKIVCYTLVAALLVSPGFTLEAEAIQYIASDLRITVSDLIPYLREVGCANASKEKAKLTAPLRLVKMGHGGGKKRRS